MGVMDGERETEPWAALPMSHYFNSRGLCDRIIVLDTKAVLEFGPNCARVRCNVWRLFGAGCLIINPSGPVP